MEHQASQEVCGILKSDSLNVNILEFSFQHSLGKEMWNMTLHVLVCSLARNTAQY